VTGGNEYWDIHVQCNKEAKLTSVAMAPDGSDRKGASIAVTLVPTDLSWTPSMIEAELKKSLKRKAGYV